MLGLGEERSKILKARLDNIRVRLPTLSNHAFSSCIYVVFYNSYSLTFFVDSKILCASALFFLISKSIGCTKGAPCIMQLTTSNPM